MKTKFGHMECLTPGCGHRVVVKKNENDTLSYSCEECDGAGYARKGQGVHAVWMKRIAPVAAVESKAPAPAKKPDEKPAPKKDEKPAKSGGSLLV